jgi:antitoxin component YwqK of YwqJK toxin-antitoxin module
VGEALPSRPSGVPAGARWSESDGEWQLSATDGEGRLEGPFRAWRPDGSLRTIARHRAGKQVDVAWRFHPDGSLFSVGGFADGSPRGIHRRYANPDPFAERLQSCCVPTGAWQLLQDFRDTGGATRRWFDRDGVRLLDSGAPYPEVPAGVPADAWFNEDTEIWEAGVSWVGDGPTGTRRRWSREGTLRLVETLVGGRRQGLVSWFDERGALVSEAEYDDDQLSGAFRAHQLPDHHFAEPSWVGYRGTFVRNQAVGDWRLLGKDGADGVRLDLGLPSSDETLAAVLEDQFLSAAHWEALAASSLAGGHVAESLLASARAAAVTKDASALRAALAKHVLPLHPDAARQGAAELVGTENVVVLADGLRRGWNASDLLLAIAKALNNQDRTAVDLATAALVLEPGTAAALATRALLWGSLGDPAAARGDIEALGPAAPERADFLALYLRAYFPTFDFWPTRELAAGEPAAVDDQSAAAEAQAITSYRTAAEVREVMRRYATRLARLRALIEARLARRDAVALPDPSPLLADGPVELGRWSFTMSAAEYGGAEEGEVAAPAEGGGDAQDEDDAEDDVVEIAVDETMGLDLGDAQLLRILRRARADWAGLVWLCWAVGLDRVALPSSLAPPADFARQAVETMQRAWRCRDKLNTSGLLALTKGIPGFDWEGIFIDDLPAPLAEVMLDEYLERRAVFAWLCDPANRSPWQDDLRSD